MTSLSRAFQKVILSEMGGGGVQNGPKYSDVIKEQSHNMGTQCIVPCVVNLLPIMTQ